EIETALLGTSRTAGGGFRNASIGHRSVRNVLSLEAGLRNNWSDSLKKGRRLTSDPIRTSLGLLPSGPDPVGEWLVHRQSPGAYLGPKPPEIKRRGDGIRPAGPK